MRSHLTLAASLLGLLLNGPSVQAQIVAPPYNESVQLRLEIEMRGVLAVTEKAATLTHKETTWEWVKNPNPRPGVPDFQREFHQVDKVWTLDLDDNLKKSAKELHGKKVIVVGKCLILGVKSVAESSKTPPTIRYRSVQQPRGLPPVDLPEVAPEGIATSVTSQLLIDTNVTVVSLKAAAN
jgi:hypothetical protein